MDVHVTDTNAKSYRGSISAKVLDRVARGKRGQVRKGLLQAAVLFHGACLLSRLCMGWLAKAPELTKNELLVSLQIG